MISTATFIGILFTLVITTIVPIAALIFVKIKYKASLLAAMIGAAGFISFAMILEQLLHAVVIPLVMGNPLLYIIYGCLAAGIFEETSRFIGFKIMEKCHVGMGLNNAVAYGIGHGGIEALLIVGLMYFNNLVLALGINSVGAQTLAAEAGENGSAILNAINQMSAVPSGMFYLAGFERILAMLLHIGLTLLMWLCVTKRGPKALYFVCIGLHALANSGAAMMQVGINLPAFMVYIILSVAVAATYTLFFILHKKSVAKT